MTGYTYDLPPNREQLEAIGMVASEWARLESIVETAIWSLACLDEDTGQAITTHIGLPARLDILPTLFRLKHGDGPESTHLAKLCKKIRGPLSRQRGEAVHALWVRGAYGSPLHYIVRARGKLEKEKAGRPAAKIHEVAALIQQHSSELKTFLEAHRVLTPL